MNTFYLPPELLFYVNNQINSLSKESGQIFNNITAEQLLSLRATLMGFFPAAQISANKSCHLMQTNDHQWLALSLARQSDWELLPALFQQQEKNIFCWESVYKHVKQKNIEPLLYQGRSLGLAISAAAQAQSRPLLEKNKIKKYFPSQKKQTRQPLVVDLSSLWAGPLCSRLLMQCGAKIIKIESASRPDGAGLNRVTGGQAFYQWLNQGKEIILIDFKTNAGLKTLCNLLEKADIIIEGSRPRALMQLSINADDWVQKKNKLWVSISGYGRKEPQANWIAYGDDAAIGAGLFRIIDNKPAFIGDAIADPLTGVHAALSTLRHWQQGQNVLLDINLHSVAKHCAQFL